MEPVTKYLFKRQEGGTCWFHAMMTGFLLSKNGRLYLQNLVGESGAVAKGDYCPTKFATITDLLPLIRRYLLSGVNNKENIIKAFASNVKSNVSKQSGITHKEIHELYKKFFPDVNLRVRKYYKDNTKPKQNEFIFESGSEVDGTLSHAYIGIHYSGQKIGQGASHAISGIIDERGNYYIFDSATTEYKNLGKGWDTKEGMKEIKDYMQSKATSLSHVYDRITVTCVYLPKSVINKATKNVSKIQSNSKGRSIISNMVKEIKNGKRNWQLGNDTRVNHRPNIRNAKNQRIIQLLKGLEFKNLLGKMIHGIEFKSLERNSKGRNDIETAKANAVNALKRKIREEAQKIIKGNEKANKSLLKNKTYNGPWVKKTKVAMRNMLKRAGINVNENARANAALKNANEKARANAARKNANENAKEVTLNNLPPPSRPSSARPRPSSARPRPSSARPRPSSVRGSIRPRIGSAGGRRTMVNQPRGPVNINRRLEELNKIPNVLTANQTKELEELIRKKNETAVNNTARKLLANAEKIQTLGDGEPTKKRLKNFLEAYEILPTYNIKNTNLAKSLEKLHPILTKRFIALSKRKFVG